MSSVSQWNRPQSQRLIAIRFVPGAILNMGRPSGMIAYLAKAKEHSHDHQPT
jgi:hypothetical protein